MSSGDLSRLLAHATTDHPVRVGRYDVVGFIGQGGMGTVYDAIEREHGTRVALKTLTHLDPEGLARFKHEFRAAADLAHANLVPLYELGLYEGLWYFTMERIDGVDLIAWLRGDDVWRARDATASPTWRAQVTARGGSPDERAADALVAAPSLPASIPKVRAAFAELVRGVRALHAANLLHLDLKPTNVLVDRDGRVAILDFGLVRVAGAASTRRTAPTIESDSVSGTPIWMAPEQFAGGELGEATDWYAVGLMLYLALTGVPAFPWGNAAARQLVTATPPHELLRGVPLDLGELVVGLLAADPTRRPSGDDVAACFVIGGVANPSLPIASALVGRATERARLDAAFAHVAAGGVAIVHLVGASGHGKSAIAHAFVDELRTRNDALVLHGRCYERETVPYKAFDSLVDNLVARLATWTESELAGTFPPWTAELARVFPVLARLPAVATRLARAPHERGVSLVELRRRASYALRDLIARLAERAPVVLEIDDLQWADTDSADLLVELLSPPAPARLLIVTTFRREEAATSPAVMRCLGALVGLAPAVAVTTLDIGPLSREAAEQLATTTLGALGSESSALAAAIAREASGVPFFVEELAHFAVQRGATTLAEISLESVLADRVQALPEAERRLVEVLSVANSPIPLAIAFAAADVDRGSLRALWNLRGKHLVRSTGARAADLLELHHDRMRESVMGYLASARIDDLHVRLGRALAGLADDASDDTHHWLFDAVRHLNSALELAGADRRDAARLNLLVGRTARRTAAFPLAYDCFRAGVRMLEADAWHTDYALALDLHAGAAEAAYLSAHWAAVETHVAQVKANGRTILDQLGAWEVDLDAAIARRAYGDAIDRAVDALALLGVALPARPLEADVGAAVEAAIAYLARTGLDALLALPEASEPEHVAAMRIQGRITSAAYFARPMLLPVLACRLVVASIDHGVTSVTPYALAVHGIVLNTLGLYREAHACGQTALRLLDRWIERTGDRSHDARTRHVVHNLVCPFVAPLASILDDLQRVVDIGRATGDLEYAAYAAHGHVHDAFYAGRELGALYDEALAAGTFMRGHQQVNALHVHAPFEMLLRCFTGRAHDPSRLVGDGFDETAALEAARAAGSRSAQCIVRLLGGTVRFHFGDRAEASALFEEARPFLDGVASTWHVPIFHQLAALAIHALPTAARAPLRDRADADLAVLRALAEHGPENFAHRVALVEAERYRADGAFERALESYVRAISLANTHGWANDLALAHELAARCRLDHGDRAEAARHLRAARDAYARWGARAKLAALDALT